jgi:hypothetical protein
MSSRMSFLCSSFQVKQAGWSGEAILAFRVDSMVRTKTPVNTVLEKMRDIGALVSITRFIGDVHGGVMILTGHCIGFFNQPLGLSCATVQAAVTTGELKMLFEKSGADLHLMKQIMRL